MVACLPMAKMELQCSNMTNAEVLWFTYVAYLVKACDMWKSSKFYGLR